MRPEVSIAVLSSGKEWVRTVRLGASYSCSLITHKEDLDDYPLNGKRVVPVATKADKAAAKEAKKSKPNSVDAAEGDDHPFKAGDTVTYQGKKCTITRAYFYKGKPICILDKTRQVSANSLTKK